MHYLGVEHRDLEPQNVLQNNRSYIFKIIDFGLDVDHACPGWGECAELNKVWRELQLSLDSMIFWFKSLVPFLVRLGHNLEYSRESENVTANTLIPVIVSSFVQL